MNRSVGYVCSCFFTHNIFLKELNLHVKYLDKKQFMRDYQTVLAKKGCSTEAQIEDVLSQVNYEIDRRKRLPQEKLERTKEISQKYSRLKPHVYNLHESFLTPEFMEILNLSKEDTSLEELEDRINAETAERVYSLPVFTKEFCNDLMDELTNFENTDLPKGRPNTMNNYGILLDELGFDDNFLDPLREHYLNPIAKVLYPDYGGGMLDSHKAFIVKYKLGEDLDLCNHYDNAELTLNVCLGREFSGGELYFGSMRAEHCQDSVVYYKNKPCIGLLQRGQHVHGALPIESGERYNLIIWMRSSKVRNRLCPMCDRVPNVVETVSIHDGFVPSNPVDVCSMH